MNHFNAFNPAGIPMGTIPRATVNKSANGASLSSGYKYSYGMIPFFRVSYRTCLLSFNSIPHSLRFLSLATKPVLSSEPTYLLKELRISLPRVSSEM